MDAIPRDYEARCMFDAFCETVLHNEAKSYLVEVKRRRDREASPSSLSQTDLDKLCTVDHYPSDSLTFSSHGYDLHINNELAAEAFAMLPSVEQSILILHCVLDTADGEIGGLVGMSRSAVQRHRMNTLSELRKQLKVLMLKGGQTRMKSPNYKNIEPLPFSVIEAACAGDVGVVERVLQYYSGYMNKLCTWTLYDENGYLHVCLDEATRRRLEIKLIHVIVMN